MVARLLTAFALSLRALAGTSGPSARFENMNEPPTPSQFLFGSSNPGDSKPHVVLIADPFRFGFLLGLGIALASLCVNVASLVVQSFLGAL